MTIIKLRNGKELKVKGSVQDVKDAYSKKPNTSVQQSRINDNYTIFINGNNVGEIQA